jgi:hypothetical protein
MVDQQGTERTPEQPRSEPLAAQPSTTMQDNAGSNPLDRTSTMLRPGLVTFAAVMMLVLGGFHVLLAISEFANSAWVMSRLDIVLIIRLLIIWGIIDLIIGCIALFAGASILRGGAFGWITGFIFATLGIIRWLFYVPVSPVLAVVVIALAILVIYGLARHLDYFVDS